jgi:gamma-glutamylputrescine oxidase
VRHWPSALGKMRVRVNVVLAADFRAMPLWLDEAPLQPANAPVPARADVAVVGGGYCGLSAARVLAQAGLSVVVLDAGEPGAGASTRNHGHLGGGGKLPPKLDEAVGTERASLIRQDAVESVEFIKALIREEALPVDYAERGRFIAAHSPSAFVKLQARADSMRTGLGLTVGVVPRDRQREEIGSDFYYGGVTVAEAAALQPAKLHREMRRLAEAAGAVLCGRARVETVGQRKGGFRVQTTRGLLLTEHVVMATNAYSGSAVPFIRDRIVPVTAYMIATEPMPVDLATDILPRNRTGGDTKRALYAFRRSPDGRRVVFAGRAKFRDIDERQAAAILHRFMCGVWPQMRGVRVSHCWKGFVGFTFDFLPHMGEIDGMHYAAGCQGAGLAMMSYLGHQIGLKILRRQNRPCGLDTARFPTLPFYRGRPWFLPVVGGYYNLRDRIDRTLALATGR